MKNSIIALYALTLCMVGLGPIGQRDEPSFVTSAHAQTAKEPKPFPCEEDENRQRVVNLAPGSTVPVHQGYAVAANHARYLSDDGKVTIDVCITLRRFLEGEEPERQTIELQGSDGKVVIYLQEKELDRVRR